MRTVVVHRNDDMLIIDPLCHKQGIDMKQQLARILVALCATVCLSSWAETIIIPVGQQAAEKQVLERPRRGSSKEQVKAHFGDPVSITPAVGAPPISSWEYPDFTVYFEYNHVLHSVLKRTSSGNQGME